MRQGSQVDTRGDDEADSRNEQRRQSRRRHRILDDDGDPAGISREALSQAGQVVGERAVSERAEHASEDFHRSDDRATRFRFPQFDGERGAADGERGRERRLAHSGKT
jgi:hypothetical protein